MLDHFSKLQILVSCMFETVNVLLQTIVCVRHDVSSGLCTKLLLCTKAVHT